MLRVLREQVQEQEQGQEQVREQEQEQVLRVWELVLRVRELVQGQELLPRA